MPCLVRKLLVIAAVDGLILQPHGTTQRNGSNGHNAIQIQYKTRKISSVPVNPNQTQQEEQDGKSDKVKKRDAELEVHGVVGLLSVASYSFLISITQREQVAQILGRPIYAVTNVAIIPLSSQSDASRAILQAQENLSGGELGPGETASEESESSDTDASSSSSSSTSDAAESEVGEDQVTSGPAHKRVGSVSSIVEDVIGKKGFRGNWFSRQWGLRRSNVVGKEGDPGLENDPAGTVPGPELSDVKEETTTSAAEGAIPSKEEARETQTADETVELMPKLLRYTKLLFSSKNFFFAYDYDLTRRFGVEDPINAHSPLYTTVDPLYFWNKHLMTPLIEAGAHSFILPLMQGFVGQQQFSVAAGEQKPTEERGPDEPPAKGKILGEKQEGESSSEKDPAKQDFLLTLISRRSVMRPGLRYLRRGVDDDGNTANTVETEQILSTPSWDPSRKVYSLLQLRGSIPIYFSQSPYSLKPVPVLHHSDETNQLAFNKHFREIRKRYGKIQAVSLIDKNGGEGKVGEAYDKYARALNEGGGLDGTPLRLEWFDFHAECRGMKFENIKKLVDSLEETLDEYGETVVQNNTVRRTQTGIVRTNCMDCLDRTGVAQCAFGGRALERELRSEGISIDLHGDSSTQWFNILWADNGDAISKQYSSTAALKGDYTRTRKRDYRGALNDLGLTLSRYFNNIVNDYFSQACIDYLLGNVSTGVFKEFAMELQSADPGISIQKLRQNAIDTSCQIVIGDQHEELLGGWTILTPRQPNTLRTLPFEECVLLLTDSAIYNCRFDWNTDKVLSFERIDLRSIVRIHYGTYITSVLTDTQQDEHHNVGLVLVYRDADENALRVNTRSLRSLFKQQAQDTESGEKKPPTRFMAFKALPVSSSVTVQNRNNVAVSEIDSVRSICEEIQRAMAVTAPTPGETEKKSIIEEQDIISLEEAKKRTGLLEHLVYDIKKLVWA